MARVIEFGGAKVPPQRVGAMEGRENSKWVLGVGPWQSLADLRTYELFSMYYHYLLITPAIYLQPIAVPKARARNLLFWEIFKALPISQSALRRLT
jgi:hypothetical protein